MRSKIFEKLNKVDKGVEDVGYQYGWTYIGRGCYGTEDDHFTKADLSLKECVSMCNIKRHTDGASWNGIVWDITDHQCWCEKNDRGHDTGYPNYLHFVRI